MQGTAIFKIKFGTEVVQVVSNWWYRNGLVPNATYPYLATPSPCNTRGRIIPGDCIYCICRTTGFGVVKQVSPRNLGLAEQIRGLTLPLYLQGPGA